MIKVILLKFQVQTFQGAFSVIGTLTCANGFIRIDIHSKDVMLVVCFGIFILQGKSSQVNAFLIFYFSIGWRIHGLGQLLPKLSRARSPTRTDRIGAM